MTEDFSSQAHFGDYTPTSFGWKRAVPDLVPLEFDGVSFGSCARDARPVFMALLADLVPHIEGGLHVGSCGAYSTTDDLPDGSWSFHRYGIAIDVNWNVNKMGTPSPATGKYAIPHDVASQVARKYGCEYGGDWTNPKDWMHFEVHLTPEVARTVTPEDDMTPDQFRAIIADEIHKALKGDDGAPHQMRTIVDQEVQPKLDALAADLKQKMTALTGLVIHGDKDHPNSQDAVGPLIQKIAEKG